MSNQLAQALSGADIPIRLQVSRLESFDPSRAPGGQAALDWATANVSEPRSGFLAGTVGTGKSHLVCALVVARAGGWLERWPLAIVETAAGVTARPAFTDLFVDVPEMLDTMRRWIARPEGPDPLDRYSKASLLILDDLGREKVTDWATERLYVLVNSRYGDLLPTIATSNLRPSELARNSYEPIVRRLLDGRPAIWLSHGKAGGE